MFCGYDIDSFSIGDGRNIIPNALLDFGTFRSHLLAQVATNKERRNIFGKVRNIL